MTITLDIRDYRASKYVQDKPPNGPSVPPECSNLQWFAHCCALPAKVLFQVRGTASCWALIELCAVRYAWISAAEVPPVELTDEGVACAPELEVVGVVIAWVAIT